MKTSKVTGLVLVTALTLGTTAQAELTFSKSGYFRLGTGETDGGEYTEMQLNGADTKYRLGNEQSFYGEFGAHANYIMNTGSEIMGIIRYHAAGDVNDLDLAGDFPAGVALREMWIGYKGLGQGAFQNSMIWAGRRYYKRKDIHINDFFYEDYSTFDGFGLGIENIATGTGDLSFAIFSDKDSTVLTYDARLEGIPLGDDLYGEIGVAYADPQPGTPGDAGFAVRGHLLKEDFMGDGFLKASVMYSYGAAYGFKGEGAPGKTRDDTMLRTQIHALFPIGERTDAMATASYQVKQSANSKLEWTSIGIRPQYQINDNFAIAAELGYDHVVEDSDSRYLFKATIAGIYTFGNSGFWGRPQMRVFATTGNWSEPGAIPGFGTKTSGTTVGIQYETWF